MMTLTEMAQYLIKLALKQEDESDKMTLAEISGALFVFAQQCEIKQT